MVQDDTVRYSTSEMAKVLAPRPLISVRPLSEIIVLRVLKKIPICPPAIASCGDSIFRRPSIPSVSWERACSVLK